MSDTPLLNLPDELGALIDGKLKEGNPDLDVGWLLIAVVHAQPIQTFTNLEVGSQIAACQIAAQAIANDSMNVSNLLNPEGSA